MPYRWATSVGIQLGIIGAPRLQPYWLTSGYLTNFLFFKKMYILTEKDRKALRTEIISQISYECPYENLKFTLIMYFILYWITEFLRKLSCLVNHLLHKHSTTHSKSEFLNLHITIWLTRLQSKKSRDSTLLVFSLRINNSRWLPLLLSIAVLLTPSSHHTFFHFLRRSLKVINQ